MEKGSSHLVKSTDLPGLTTKTANSLSTALTEVSHARYVGTMFDSLKAIITKKDLRHVQPWWTAFY